MNSGIGYSKLPFNYVTSLAQSLGCEYFKGLNVGVSQTIEISGCVEESILYDMQSDCYSTMVVESTSQKSGNWECHSDLQTLAKMADSVYFQYYHTELFSWFSYISDKLVFYLICHTEHNWWNNWITICQGKI